VPSESLSQVVRLVLAACGQWAKFVRVASLRMSVSNEEDQHLAENSPHSSGASAYGGNVPRPLRYVIADVFTDRPFAGNQLAVFTDAQEIDEATMQALSAEMGFSESAFVLPPERGGTVRVRIFTPMTELPFAGHPLLGTAWVLGTPLQRRVVELETDKAIVPVELERDESGAIVYGRMLQPLPRVESYPDPDGLLRALGIERSLLPVERYDNGVRHTFVALGSREEVASLQPDYASLASLDVMANCFAGSGTSWKLRMFAPGDGVPEDPATGSAAGPLACHLCRHGLTAWGTAIEVLQGAELGRPSRLYARAVGADGTAERVEVGGQAVLVARGEFRL
jgi:trans-2,3-dihydro-3-hydroxyanthranilate isomerase